MTHAGLAGGSSVPLGILGCMVALVHVTIYYVLESYILMIGVTARSVTTYSKHVQYDRTRTRTDKLSPLYPLV
ncbi:hypothetical protein BD310DRAFT_931231 [Dichomitus squalens]|uniref:Uncharacterized protein n=1 Tax=Dichomitus squalens TaxID=114155 RepID=A0A4Q9PQG3_9APHY|nr:hypothetical protein BD310DRAFT_931231 [Dichomitus squalens]